MPQPPGGACTDAPVTTAELEERVLDGIRQRLLTPALVAGFAAQIQKELDDASRDVGGVRATIEVELVDTRARIEKLVRRIEEDEHAPCSLIDRLKQLEQAEARLAGGLADAPERKVVRLPADYEEVYARRRRARSAPGRRRRSAARATIPSLVERIVVEPGDAQGGKSRAMQLHGDLFGMPAFADRAASAGSTSAQKAQRPRSGCFGGVVIPVVAGTGFEPVTFRL